MSDVLVPKSQITQYIPQRYPIIMVDEIIACEGTSCTTSFKILNSNIFFKNGVMQEPGVVENIAQTAAAKAGFEVVKMGAEPLVGFIGAIKDLMIYDLPKENELLQTTVTVKMEIMGVTLVDAESSVNGRNIASCEMKIVLQKPENKE